MLMIRTLKSPIRGFPGMFRAGGITDPGLGAPRCTTPPIRGKKAFLMRVRRGTPLASLQPPRPHHGLVEENGWMHSICKMHHNRYKLVLLKSLFKSSIFYCVYWSYCTFRMVAASETQNSAISAKLRPNQERGVAVLPWLESCMHDICFVHFHEAMFYAFVPVQ